MLLYNRRQKQQRIMISGIHRYAAFILRVTLGFVFFWKGMVAVFIGELAPQSQIILDVIGIRTQVETVNFVIGVIALILGIVLLIGLFTKVSANIAATYILISILLYILFVPGGYAEFVWKDIGLLGSALALGMFGSPIYGIDSSFMD